MNGLDFIAITEHSEVLNLIANEEEGVNTPLSYRTEWEDIQYQADGEMIYSSPIWVN